MLVVLLSTLANRKYFTIFTFPGKKINTTGYKKAKMNFQ